MLGGLGFAGGFGALGIVKKPSSLDLRSYFSSVALAAASPDVVDLLDHEDSGLLEGAAEVTIG